MAGGLTFGAVKSMLSTVVDNGVDPTDGRVLIRTNQATEELLKQKMIPVGAMMTIDTVVDADGFILLPQTMENVIAFNHLDSKPVNGQTDVTQGFIDVVNNFDYIDPSITHDNPLIDWFLVPDPDDPTVLRRKYEYPGGNAGASVRLTGKKAYVPLTGDGDYLIVQNISAMMTMILGIERRENNQTDDYLKLKAAAKDIIKEEIDGHMMDVTRSMYRKANWEADLATYNIGTMGWTRARLALEIPWAQKLGKEELTRLLQRSEMRLMELGTFKGTLEEFSAPVVCGHVVMPQRVESILAADLEGQHLNLRSIFFKYLQNGPGDWRDEGGCILEDEGEITMNDGFKRHKYRLNTGGVYPTTTAAPSSTTPDEIDAGTFLYVGEKMRLVAMTNGVRLEILDGTGHWITEDTWSE